MTDGTARADARRAAIRAGLSDGAPMLLGIVPFGLVAGAAPVAAGMSVADAAGLSTFVFAGASQLAITDVLDDGGGWLVAVATAIAINLRLLLYSASLAPWVAHEPPRRRLGAAYLLVDQNYALSISRWPVEAPSFRLPYFVAQGLLFWTSWQVCTLVGAVGGSRVPDDVPLDFALPLVFLVLLVPALTTWPALVAALGAGSGAVLAGEVGASRVSVLVGVVAGVVAGSVADTVVGQLAERAGP